MDRLKTAAASFLLALALAAAALFPGSAPAAAQEARPAVVYFYFSVCEQCQTARKAVQQTEAIFREKGLEAPDVRCMNAESKANYELLDRYYELYRVPEEDRILPVLFVGKKYYSGEKNIEAGLRSLAAAGTWESTPLLSADGSGEALRKQFSAMTAANVFLTGLVNGFNPCSLSMALFLFSLLLARRANVLKMGLSFTAGKAVMYLLLGTFLLDMLGRLQNGWFGLAPKLLLLFFTLAVAALNLWDFAAARRGEYDRMRNRLPTGLRKGMENVVLFAASGPAAPLYCFLLGLAVSVGEFLCTGQLYLAAIALTVRSSGGRNLTAIFYLAVYVCAFLAPLTAAVVLIARGRAVLELSGKLQSHLPVIKLVSALVFAAAGIIYFIS